MHRTFKFSHGELEVEIGKFAKQADGSVWIKSGDNVVLSTVVATKEEKEFIGFFPLTVEYRQRMSAAGKIPGGYIKREGRLSDVEVLTSRLIDRSVRPLFPKYYFNEVQLLSTVYSSDGKFPTNILSVIGSSLALSISSIPFRGPIGAIQIGRINGEWKFNASYEEMLTSDAHIIIAGTAEGVTMVEGDCNSVSENELIDLIFQAHEVIKKQIEWQNSIKRELNVVMEEPATSINWPHWEERVSAAIAPDFISNLFTQVKAEREEVMSSARKSLLEHFAEEIKAGDVPASIIKFLFNQYLKVHIPNAVAQKNQRLDGRDFNQVRPISCEVGTLPCVHGSAVFQRGETQALASLTLGTAQDAQKVDTLLGGVLERSFMLHYNFPPFSTGEVRPIRGVGRREIGHGYLAETSFKNVLPSQEEFPYTIRTVSDVLESNGSSSMATVCATTLALMDSGVPIKEMVSGIAMGLMKASDGKLHTLTDILGIEDAFGLMDFKITGTESGVMAVQMDIKAEAGLTRDVLSNALEQAKEGRLHILAEMKKVLSVPRESVSKLAPRVISFKIPQDKIGAIIGPGGKTIKEIIARTNVQVDIEDDGTVKIYSREAGNADEAVAWIRVLSGDIKAGSEFDGPIKRIADFGIFVELVPGKDGLIHVSKISRDRQRQLEKLYKVNDVLKVKVLSYDKETGHIRLIAPELEQPLEKNEQ